MEDTSVVRLGAVVLDCPDPLALAGFYAAVLGCSVTADSTDEWADLDGAGSLLSFQRAPGHQPPSWPDGTPQQVHLDLRVTDYAEPHERAVAHGAVPLQPTTAPNADGEPGFRVYADPAGHPFCLCMC